MDRLVRILIVLTCTAFVAGNCNQRDQNEQSLCQIYFGNKFIAKMFCNELDGQSPSVYIKVFNYNNKEVYKFYDANFPSIGIDSIKNDTLFLFRKVFSPKNPKSEKYKIVKSDKFTVYSRDIILYGSAGGESKKVTFLQRNKNSMYFKNQSLGSVDSVSLSNLFFSGDEASIVKYLDQSDKRILYFEHLNFISLENKKLFFTSFRN